MMSRKSWRRIPALLALATFGLLQPTFVCGLDCAVHRAEGTQMSASAQHALVAPCHGQQLTHDNHPPLSPTGVAPLPPAVRVFHTSVVRIPGAAAHTRPAALRFLELDTPPPRA